MSNLRDRQRYLRVHTLELARYSLSSRNEHWSRPSCCAVLRAATLRYLENLWFRAGILERFRDASAAVVSCLEDDRFRARVGECCERTEQRENVGKRSHRHFYCTGKESALCSVEELDMATGKSAVRRSAPVPRQLSTLGGKSVYERNTQVGWGKAVVSYRIRVWAKAGAIVVVTTDCGVGALMHFWCVRAEITGWEGINWWPRSGT